MLNLGDNRLSTTADTLGESPSVKTSNNSVAVIGGGVSGIAAANVWRRCGYDVVVYESSEAVGGLWCKAYPGVRLQNTSPQYVFAEFDWPFEPDRHPTGEQLLRYLRAAVAHFDLDVRLKHRVQSMEEVDDGWTLTIRSADGEHRETFCHVVVAIGQYPADDKFRPQLPGESDFNGKIVHAVQSLDQFDGRRVVVVGNGKTALDMASLAGERAQACTHVFRTPRWQIPDFLLGIDYTRPLFSRIGTIMMPSWVHPSAAERALHDRLAFVVNSFWTAIAELFRFQYRRQAGSGANRSVLDEVTPPTAQFQTDLRSATPVAPPNYHAQLVSGAIIPIRDEVAGLHAHGVTLTSGKQIDCDVVALCLGNAQPQFPFLPEDYRALMEQPRGGAQLYRHLIHPKIPNVGFAGFNHGFLHIATAEMGALWQVAVRRGELELPSQHDMLASMKRVADWKAEHQSFEPSRNFAVSTRFQQHLDVLLTELGFSPYRKLPNVFAELLSRYSPADYQGVVDTYLKRAAKRSTPLKSLPLD